MGVNLKRQGARWARLGRDIGTYAGGTAIGRWQEWMGAGAGAVRRQASLIRYLDTIRESMWAYERLDELVARYGDADLGLAIDERQPRYFVMFVGHSRSGHSLVGSLLDAHPDAAIAHEQYAARHLLAGHSADRVLRALQYNSQIFERLGRHYSGYQYTVPGQYQGRLVTPLVIGDKKGGGTTRLLRRDPEATVRRLLDRAPATPLFVHVVRNPFDNIATKAVRTRRGLSEAASLYFRNAAAIQSLCELMPGFVLHLSLDELIADPDNVLGQLLAFLGLSAPEDYRRACADILFAQPRQTRHAVDWPDGLIASVDRHASQYPFLEGFAGTFDDDG